MKILAAVITLVMFTLCFTAAARAINSKRAQQSASKKEVKKAEQPSLMVNGERIAFDDGDGMKVSVQ